MLFNYSFINLYDKPSTSFPTALRHPFRPPLRRPAGRREARDEAARNVSEAAKALSASEQLLAGEHDAEAASVAVAAAAEAVEAAVVMAEGNARLEAEARQLQERLGRVRQILADATARAAARKVRLCVHAMLVRRRQGPGLSARHLLCAAHTTFAFSVAERSARAASLGLCRLCCAWGKALCWCVVCR